MFFDLLPFTVFCGSGFEPLGDEQRLCSVPCHAVRHVVAVCSVHLSPLGQLAAGGPNPKVSVPL